MASKTPAAANSKAALDAYRRGSLEKAIELQRRVVTARGVRPQERDFLLLGLFLHSANRLAEGISLLESGLRLYPKSPDLHENMGTFLKAEGRLPSAIEALQRALALGSQSTNVLDGLCEALFRVGEKAESAAYGRRSLELKDARFSVNPSLGKIPAASPPPFDSSKPAQNVISYVLWGENPRYLAPLLENLRIQPHLFPGWTMRVYLDSRVAEKTRLKLQQGGAQIVLKEQAKGGLPALKLLWRFEVIADRTIRRFLVRDADALLSVKERVAVDDWLHSAKYFHVMRDAHSHTDLVLAGLWGGVGGVLPPVQTLVQNFKPWRVENDHVDQDLLNAAAWPTIRRSCLIHDSVFPGCLGSVPFPPYGELLKGHHVGQNAFVHFKPGK